jgi:hypothetical protein
MWYLEETYGNYTEWFLDYQQANPCGLHMSSSLDLDGQLAAFKLAYGNNVFDGFYPWLQQHESIFDDPSITGKPVDLTAVKKVNIYPYWSSDTFCQCHLMLPNCKMQYEDLYIGLDAVRYYIEEYKGKNADNIF